MTEAEKILRETVGKDCIWEEMNNLTNTPIDLIVKAMEIYKKQALTIPVVRDSLNFGFCKYPQEVCDTQCQDCKAEEMWGNKNLH